MDHGEVSALFGIIKSCTEHGPKFSGINAHAMSRLMEINEEVKPAPVGGLQAAKPKTEMPPDGGAEVPAGTGDRRA